MLDRPSHPVTVYIQSADFDASLAAVEAAGGRTLASHAPVFALFADPDGNTIGLVSPQEDLEGQE